MKLHDMEPWVNDYILFKCPGVPDMLIVTRDFGILCTSAKTIDLCQYLQTASADLEQIMCSP